MEYWSIEKNDIKPLAITPTLQCSNTPNLIEIQIFQQKDYLVLVYRTVSLVVLLKCYFGQFSRTGQGGFSQLHKSKVPQHTLLVPGVGITGTASDMIDIL